MGNSHTLLGDGHTKIHRKIYDIGEYNLHYVAPPIDPKLKKNGPTVPIHTLPNRYVIQPKIDQLTTLSGELNNRLLYYGRPVDPKKITYISPISAREFLARHSLDEGNAGTRPSTSAPLFEDDMAMMRASLSADGLPPAPAAGPGLDGLEEEDEGAGRSASDEILEHFLSAAGGGSTGSTPALGRRPDPLASSSSLHFPPIPSPVRLDDGGDELPPMGEESSSPPELDPLALAEAEGAALQASIDGRLRPRSSPALGGGAHLRSSSGSPLRITNNHDPSRPRSRESPAPRSPLHTGQDDRAEDRHHPADGDRPPSRSDRPPTGLRRSLERSLAPLAGRPGSQGGSRPTTSSGLHRSQEDGARPTTSSGLRRSQEEAGLRPASSGLRRSQEDGARPTTSSGLRRSQEVGARPASQHGQEDGDRPTTSSGLRRSREESGLRRSLDSAGRPRSHQSHRATSAGSAQQSAEPTTVRPDPAALAAETVPAPQLRPPLESGAAASPAARPPTAHDGNSSREEAAPAPAPSTNPPDPQPPAATSGTVVEAAPVHGDGDGEAPR
ncbi:hypothetical protein PAPYR_4186 [Paratrimastix pyriformis]|uniref:Uncharacterized protein n=1 Tax=Paratrimastix pyriformis TaxID=342808 RepID=A0ABQ8UKP8_9EUKA|nr:hypothetical protein PAPYR_4186 [Paratrimastix pyriformis]